VIASDGKPVTGAQVVVGEFRDFLSVKVFSGREGAYRLRGLPTGEIEAYSQRVGRGKASKKFVAQGREMIEWNPVLAQDLEIRGRVLDENDASLEGFVLLVEEQTLGGRGRRETLKKARTDGAGLFTFGELSDLAYRITVHESENSLPCGLLEEVRPGGGEVEIRVDRQALSSAYLLGRVQDAQGNAYPGAKVICYSAIGGYRVFFTGKEGGAFRLGPLPSGRYAVEVQVPGHASLALGEHEVEPGEEKDLGLHFLAPPRR
jgi:hypothetical protein